MPSPFVQSFATASPVVSFPPPDSQSPTPTYSSPNVMISKNIIPDVSSPLLRDDRKKNPSFQPYQHFTGPREGSPRHLRSHTRKETESPPEILYENVSQVQEPTVLLDLPTTRRGNKIYYLPSTN